MSLFGPFVVRTDGTFRHMSNVHPCLINAILKKSRVNRSFHKSQGINESKHLATDISLINELFFAWFSLINKYCGVIRCDYFINTHCIIDYDVI